MRRETTRHGADAKEILVFEGEDDEQEFLVWQSQHPDGFVVHPTSTATPLHRAGCGHIGDPWKTAKGPSLTPMGKPKYCGENKLILLEHVRLAGYELRGRECESCNCPLPREYQRQGRN